MVDLDFLDYVIKWPKLCVLNPRFYNLSLQHIKEIDSHFETNIFKKIKKDAKIGKIKTNCKNWNTWNNFIYHFHDINLCNSHKISLWIGTLFPINETL